MSLLILKPICCLSLTERWNMLKVYWKVFEENLLIYLYHLSISPVCSCEIRRQEGACGPLLGGCPGSPRWADGRGVSLVFYCRSTRMMQFLLLTWYLGPTWYLVPASTCLGVIFDSAVVSSLLSVCCCVTRRKWYTARHKHTLDGESPVVA